MELQQLISKLQDGQGTEDEWTQLLMRGLKSTTLTDINKMDVIGVVVNRNSQVLYGSQSRVKHDQETPTLTQLHSSTESEEDRQAHSLLRWTLANLVRMLCEPVQSDVTLRASDLVSTLLRGSYGRNPYLFSNLVKLLVLCLAELAEIHLSFCEDQDEDFLPELKQLQLANDETNIDLSFGPVTFSDFEICEQLEINIIKVLTSLCPELCQFGLNGSYQDRQPISQLLWATLAFDLNLGDVLVKTVTLELACILLRNRRLPYYGEIRDCIIKEMTDLTGMLATGFSKLPGDYEALEHHLADCLTCIVELTKSPACPLDDRLSIQEAMMLSLTSTIIAHGTLRLRTSYLQKTICNLLSAMYKALPGSLMKGRMAKAQRSQACSILIKEIGQTQDSQHVNSILTIAIGLDISPDTSIPGVREDVTVKPGRKRPAPEASQDSGDSCEVSCMDELSKLMLFKALIRQVNSMCQCISDTARNPQQVGCALNGIKVAMQVIIQCLATISLSTLLPPRGTLHVKPLATRRNSGDTGQKVTLLSELIESLTTALELMLYACVDNAILTQKVADGFAEIALCINSLLCVQEVLILSNSMLTNICWILSIPWLTCEITWADFRPPDDKHLRTISATLSDKIGVQAIGYCIQGLCHLPRDLAPSWRTQVLRLAMDDSRCSVGSSAVQWLPVFLQQRGPSANHLVRDLLHGNLLEKEVVIAQSLANVVGPLACVVSGKAILVRKCEITEAAEGLVIRCAFCDKLKEEQGGIPRDRPRVVDPAMFLPILELLQRPEVEVKLGVIRNMWRLFGHISVRANNVTTVKMLMQCLQLMEDSDHKVRSAFSRNIQHVVSEVQPDDSKTKEVIVQKLKSVAKQANKAEDSSHRETILRTVGQLGRVTDGDLLLVIMVILLDSICTPACPLAAAVSHNQLQAIMDHKKVEVKRHFFMQHGKNFSKLMVSLIHRAQSGQVDSTSPISIIRNVADVFEFSGIRAFLSKTESLLLPHLVQKATSHASDIIRLISTHIGDRNHKKILVRNICSIFCHLVFNCEKDDLDLALKYLEKESEHDLTALLRSGGETIYHELLLHLARHNKKVLMGLNILMKKLAPPGTVDDITDDIMVERLQLKLLGALIHFDNHLNNGTVPLDEKYEAFESLIPLMKMMGTKHITSVRLRLMTTLKIGLKFKKNDFPMLCYHTWKVFVEIVETGALGPMLSQLVVNLLPLLQELPKQTADILHYLIVDNKEHLESHFHELYFLPELPELAEVQSVLRHHLQTSSYSSSDIRPRLSSLHKGITHESQDVRMQALNQLRHLLYTNQDVLHKTILAAETVDPVISQIVTALLSGCGESDSTLRNLYGQCLGELGAIDPGRLELHLTHHQEALHHFQASVAEESFTVDLINQLSKAFLRAEDRTTQDCVAFSIQQLIQIYDITTDPGSQTAGGKLWRRFSEEVQEIMLPLMHSKYILQKPYDYSRITKPIYLGKAGSKFDAWVSTLTGYISSKVTHEKAKQVFDCCRGIIKNDHQVALYLLPYCAVHLLLDGTENDSEELLHEILAVLQHVKEPETRQGSASDRRHLCAQTIFSLLDHLTRWTRHRIIVMSMSLQARKNPGENPYSGDENYKRIHNFLERIPLDLLALASYNCGAYTRALLHYEHFIRSEKQGMQGQHHFDFLQKLYVELNEPDGVTGITATKQTQPTLNEQILAFESTGHLSDASVCYDRIIQADPANVSYRSGLLRCRLALGELVSAMDLANSMISERPAWRIQLNDYRVQAAWKLGQWDKLNNYIETEKHNQSWDVGLGRLLLAARARKTSEFEDQLSFVRNRLMGPLSAASMEMGSYQRGYDYIVRLQMLTELEQGARVLLGLNANADTIDQSNESDGNQFTKLIQHWSSRLQFTQGNHRIREPILHLRRILLTLAAEDSGNAGFLKDAEEQVGQCWLQTAQIARQCGLIQTAHSSLLAASTFKLPEFPIENAMWLWEKNDQDKAQICLEKAIEEHYKDRTRFKPDNKDVSPADRLACAKVLLMHGRYSEETASLESNTIMRQYREVSQVHSQWEDGFFFMAKYYDKIMTKLIVESGESRPEKRGEFVIMVVQNFSASLNHGSQYIYQSMPRMLTLWLDFGSEVMTCDRGDTALQGMRMGLQKLNKIMANTIEKLAPYQFLTAFPQLISRICHAHPEVFSHLKDLIAKILITFPQQAVWLMMAVSKSTYQMRVKRCQEIFSKAMYLDDGIKKFLHDATKLTDRLLELCNKNVDSSLTTLSISQNFKTLQRIISDKHFSQILIPLQSLMIPTLPSIGAVAGSTHNPFPDTQVYIKGIEDTVEVLASLQRPKKITLRGSNGRLYIMLCKPKDDLRKDARLMEFNSIVNKCLRKDPESRRRDLHIRTYTVTPLNEECGMLEWVSNTNGLRQILLKLYKERGIYTSGKELKAMQLPPNAPLERKLVIYKNKLLPRHPPLFSEWFHRTFPDPTSWYNARLAYCRTAAVVSMVGYILGLGDRHGENIMLDSQNGDCVHVDFNCLFNKGETFDYPEIVPFRLTHNMVEAMGPMGFEGVFRRACEVTLRVMRTECDPLMSVLKTFIFDPLVEWSKPVRGRSNPTETGEIRNEKAQTHVDNIEARLRGCLKNKTKGLPLSVEGQVSHLIKQATSESNLAQMYIGWAAYL